MKQHTTFHEILLFTGTAFSHRSFSRKDEYYNGTNKLSELEELERSCWEGLLYEMFPEILGSFSSKCESFIWHIMSGKNFLSISIGPVPPGIENETTIDPYFFMATIREN